MSRQLISRSPDLQRLRDEGYDVSVRAGHLLLANVPYVNAAKQVRLGMLVAGLTLAGDATAKPMTHVAMFAGEYPCDATGTPIDKIRNQTQDKDLSGGLVINHTFSSKPVGRGRYDDYYEMMTTYAAIISSPAQTLDPNATPRCFPVVETEDAEAVFLYEDTASSRAGIGAVADKLRIGKMAIIGLGGTGSYVLDLVAKVPVKEIHLFDGDRFLQHNAFRSPGAPSMDELRRRSTKVAHYQRIYSRMRRGVIAHEYAVDESNVTELHAMDFVFVCIDGGAAKAPIVRELQAQGIPFVDVGMGIQLVDNALLGVLRVTTSTAARTEHVPRRMSMSDASTTNEYSQNIQIADLNALNATLAVIKFKKLFGFYHDLEGEHHATYTLDGNTVTNEEHDDTPPAT
jgi:hypothetical protein